MTSRRLLLLLFLFSLSAYGQLKWYKFDKTFIDQHYSQDGGAIGSLKVSAMHPAKNPHPVDCGGHDGELHIGIEENALGNGAVPISSLANQSDSNFGIVAEPPNVKRGTRLFTTIEGADGNQAAFFGYFRLWNEGHDVGQVFPSNPHHVLEIHPAWGIGSTGFRFNPLPAMIFAMPRYSGYGASKFVPLLKSVPAWLRVAEDQRFVYVQLLRADNFYQMPVTVKQRRTFENGTGVAALVDVFSDSAHQNLVYQNLTVVTAGNDGLSSRLQPNWSTFLLGFFSVNLEESRGDRIRSRKSESSTSTGRTRILCFRRAASEGGFKFAALCRGG